MPKLPDSPDYGPRPSLETGRLDRPGTGSQEVAAAAMAAATDFSNTLKANKAKQDSLNYALARNEMQSADISLQAELAEDLDWKTHDERYLAGLQTSGEDISGRYDLDPRDRALLDSELKLITAKGRISVGGNAKKLEISEGRAALDKGIDAARKAFIDAPDIQRPEIMRGQIQAIQAAEDKGYITTSEAEAYRQNLTTDFSRATLDALPRELRIEEIEESLRKRRSRSELTDQGTGVGAMSREDIMAGKGTGSSADFLHTDELAKMLERDYANDKENQERMEAYAVKSAAFEKFPNDHKKRMKYIAENSSGSVRNKAEQEADQEHNRNRAIDGQVATDLFDGYSNTINDLSKAPEPLTMNDIPVEHIEVMSAGQIKALAAAMDATALGVQHAAVTRYTDPKDGGESVDQWNARPDYGPGGKVHQDLDSAIWRTALDRPMWYAIKSEQDQLKALENASVNTPNVRPYVDDVLQAIRYNGVTSTPEKSAMAARLEIRLREAVTREQNSMKPPRQLNTNEINGILSGLMLDKAQIDVFWGTSKEISTATATTEQVEEMFLDLETAKTKDYPDTSETGGQQLSVYEYLRQKGIKLVGGKGASNEDLARAYFALEAGLGTIEVERRLRGE